MQKLIPPPILQDSGIPWFAELLNICRTFELLKETSCRAAGLLLHEVVACA